MKTKITPLKYAIHTEGDSASVGSSSIHVSIDYEVSAPFIIIEHMDTEELSEGQINVSLEELEKIIKIARKLVKLNSEG